MGQYQQWLYHREVDQQLRAQLEQLTQELQCLREQAARLEDDVSFADNPILQAVAMQQSAEALLVADQPATNRAVAATDREQPGISPALFAWSRLPNLDTQEIHTTPFTPQEPEMPSTPRPEVTLLPEDMAAFIDIHTQTIPRLRIPRLVSQDKRKAPAEQGAGPDDRTDYSIQRWRERWGRQTATAPLVLSTRITPPDLATDGQELREDIAE